MPMNEPLHRERMRVEPAAGSPKGVRRTLAELRCALADLGAGSEPVEPDGCQSGLRCSGRVCTSPRLSVGVDLCVAFGNATAREKREFKAAKDAAEMAGKLLSRRSADTRSGMTKLWTLCALGWPHEQRWSVTRKGVVYHELKTFDMKTSSLRRSRIGSPTVHQAGGRRRRVGQVSDP